MKDNRPFKKIRLDTHSAPKSTTGSMDSEYVTPEIEGCRKVGVGEKGEVGGRGGGHRRHRGYIGSIFPAANLLLHTLLHLRIF